MHRRAPQHLFVQLRGSRRSSLESAIPGRIVPPEDRHTLMPTTTVSVTWFSLALLLGAGGGLLNAVMTDNLRLLPAFVKSGGTTRVLRIGLAGNVALAALASTACVWALGFPGPLVHQADVGHLLAVLATSSCIGFGAARLATNEADKRLLHDAVCKASAAPAAPPATVRAMQTAAPWVVYTTTSELMPPPLAAWRLGL